MTCLGGSRLVLVGSRNPAKVDAVKAAVRKCFPSVALEVRGVESVSGVPDQPMGDEETLTGAINRIRSMQQRAKQRQQPAPPSPVAAAAVPGDALLVAVEGGVLLRGEDLHCFAWAAIQQAAAARISTARSAEFLLPPAISRLVLQEGLELGDADDAIFGRFQSGRGTGTVGKLTHNLVTRAGYYEHCLVMALIPFISPKLYPGFVCDAALRSEGGIG